MRTGSGIVWNVGVSSCTAQLTGKEVARQRGKSRGREQQLERKRGALAWRGQERKREKKKKKCVAVNAEEGEF